MISVSAEYALRAIVCLAGARGADGAPGAMTVQQIATTARLPAGYMAKILQQLVRAGFITSQRGINGGFQIARPATEITLLDVVHTCDASWRIAKCPLDIAEHGTRLCPLHRRLDEAAALAERALSGLTIAELLAQSDAAERACASTCLGRCTLAPEGVQP